MDNTKSFNDMAEEVGEKFKTLGWIIEVKYDRQDTWFEWTELGRSHFKNIISEMGLNKLIFNQTDVEFISKNIFYFGIKKKSIKESLMLSLQEDFDRWGNEALSICSGDKKCSFERIDIFSMIDWIYENNNHEIKIYRQLIPETSDNWVVRIPPGVYQSL